MKRLKDESGQALIITALCMTCLFGFVALATDVGIMLREKRMAQTAADGAAVAGASELIVGGATVTSAAKAAAALNGFTDGTGGATVTVHTPPLYGPHKAPAAGNTSYVEVIVSRSDPTLFMKFFGIASMTPTARAVATYGQTKGCIYTLGNTPNTPDITIVGSADITVKTCGINDNSPSPGGSKNSALYLQGKATLNAASIGIVGGVGSTGNVTLTPTPVTGVVPSSDPLAYLTTASNPLAAYTTKPSAASCLAQGTAATLPPGCYNGLSLGNNQTLNLSPGGVYVINGDLTLQATSTLNGTGVTLVLWGKTNLQGTPTMNLTAPTDNTNPLDGLLIYQPPANPNLISLQGNAGSKLEGTVYAPSAPVQLQGNAGATIALNFVVSTLTLIGDATLTDYAALNSDSVLKTVRLVE
jgi:Flp pilus assembly protein TadG